MNSSSVTATAKDEKERDAPINAVVQALQLSSPTTVRGGTVRFPYNGSNKNISAASTGAADVTKTFDQNGDPI